MERKKAIEEENLILKFQIKYLKQEIDKIIHQKKCQQISKNYIQGQVMCDHCGAPNQILPN